MKLTTKVILAISAAMILAGSVMAGIAMVFKPNITVMLNNGFQIVDYQNREKQDISEDLSKFDALRLSIEVSNINITIQRGDSYRVEGYTYGGGDAIEIKQEGDTLKIQSETASGFVFFSWNIPWENTRGHITVTIPEDKILSSLFAKSSAGETHISGIEVGSLETKNDMGTLTITDVKADSILNRLNAGDSNVRNIVTNKLEQRLDMGKSVLTNVSAETSAFLKLNAGDLIIDDCQLDNADIKCDMGMVKASNLTSKNLTANNSAGSVDITGEITGTIFTRSDMGNVTLNIVGSESDYGYSGKVDMGTFTVNGSKMDNRSSYNTSAANQIEYKVSAGNMTITFQK